MHTRPAYTRCPIVRLRSHFGPSLQNQRPSGSVSSGCPGRTPQGPHLKLAWPGSYRLLLHVSMVRGSSWLGRLDVVWICQVKASQACMHGTSRKRQLLSSPDVSRWTPTSGRSNKRRANRGAECALPISVLVVAAQKCSGISRVPMRQFVMDARMPCSRLYKNRFSSQIHWVSVLIILLYDGLSMKMKRGYRYARIENFGMYI